MSAVCLSLYDYTNIFSFYGDRGVSDDAEALKTAMANVRCNEQSITMDEYEILSEIEEVLNKCSSDGWDGYGAKAVDYMSCQEALKFYRMLPTTYPIPEVSVDPDGEVVLEWHNGPQKVFSVSVGSNNELSYAGLFGTNKTYGTEYFGDGLPQTILLNIQKVFC